jgi:hypothetical protein
MVIYSPVGGEFARGKRQEAGMKALRLPVTKGAGAVLWSQVNVALTTIV